MANTIIGKAIIGIGLTKWVISSGNEATGNVASEGVHWRCLDVDISFDSFVFEDAEPTALQRFFLIHKEIKFSEFAKMIGVDATLLRNYINGFKKPSRDREQVILKGIHALAQDYAAAAF